MNIYVVKDKEGFLHIIHGNWMRARAISVDGDIRLVEDKDIDDVIYNRLPFNELMPFKVIKS